VNLKQIEAFLRILFWTTIFFRTKSWWKKIWYMLGLIEKHYI